MESIRTFDRSTAGLGNAAEAPIIPDRLWSTMHGGWRAREEAIEATGELGERMRAAAFAWKEGIDDEVPVWTPKKSPYCVVRSGLSWGFTVLETEGKLLTVQLVVFVREGARVIGDNTQGTCTIVRAARVSAWSGPHTITH